MINVFKKITPTSHFINHLEKYLKTGHSIHQTLQIMSQSESKLKKIITKVKNKIKSNQSIESIIIDLLNTQTQFKIKPNTLNIELTPLLKQIKMILNQKQKARENFLQTIKYPVTLIILLIIITIIISTTILPTYQSFLFNLSSQELPIKPSKANPRIILIIILTITTLLLKFKKKWLNWTLPYPLIDYFWIISILLKSGYSINTTINAIQTNPKSSIHEPLSMIEKTINSTGDPIKGLIKIPNLSPYHVALLKQSHQSSQLSENCFQIAQELQKKMDQKINQIINLLTPFCIILAGGYILFLFYLIIQPTLKSTSLLLQS